MDTNLATPRVRSGRVVIAGGGLAGQRCAEALRRKGFDGQITIICAEARRPYDRPPLSKELLEQPPLGDAPSFRSVEWYERESVQLSLGVSATDLVPGERRLSLSDGSSLRYDWLVIATGSRPRRLPLLDGYDNVSVLRTLDDCQRLRDALAQRPRLAVIGAGFIGQEVAATARRLGLSVTMIEAAPCPLIGVLGVQLGEWFERLHREEGVEMLMSRTVDGVSANGTVRALRLSDHSVVEADHIVVGVGVEPDIAWLHDSGLTVDGLIPVDPHGRTAADRVLAIGDAAATFDPLAGRHLPGSHWEAAGRQGTRAAHVILGLPPGPAPVTSFWTDQYGIRIQYLGRAHLADSVQYDGEPDSRSFTATFLRAGRAVAALLVDRPRALPAARKLIEKGTS